MVDIATTGPRISCEPTDKGAVLPLCIQKKSALRDTWAPDSIAIAKAGDDKLVWPEFENEADKELQW